MNDSKQAARAVVAPPMDRPDWDQLKAEIACPLCEYNLRGLHDPRCPECGYQFQWRDLLDASLHQHPYLFESYPRNNFWSFWKTAYHGLRPSQFWTTLKPVQKCVPRRLYLYALIVGVIAFLATASEYGLAVLHLKLYPPAKWSWNPTTGVFGPIPLPWRSQWSYDIPAHLDYYLIALAAVTLWPCLTMLALMIFRISLRRANIKSTHVVRCVIYSWDAALWAGILILLFNTLRVFRLDPTSSWRYIPSPSTFWLWLGVTILFTWRLCVAYLCYLRFGHAVATVLLSQAVVWLFILAAIPLIRPEFYVWIARGY